MKNVDVKATTGKKGEQDFKEVTFALAVPEDFTEAGLTWGEDKMYKLAVAQFTTDSKNAKRAELKGKEPGALTMGRKVLEQIAKAKAGGDADMLAKLAAILGTPIGEDETE